MEQVQPGSRGAAHLSIQGSRSRDGVSAGATLITSQQWCFPVQPSSHTFSFGLDEITTNAGTSTSAQLTLPTKPRSEADRRSLYPSNSAEAGSSVDADILAAQTFLRQYHPNIDIPDHLLSRLMYDNAVALGDTAHELDGSLGIADAQAIAVLGPVAFEEKRIYAVICVGGLNNDCLLLHQLQVQIGSEEADPSLDEKPAQSSRAKDKSKEPNPIRLSFLPAHSAKQMYQTPILQVIASADRKLLAVRTHSSTSFLSLQHRDRADSTPRLHLEPIHEACYGTDDIAQHQDICFGPKDSALAVSVDRRGRIDLYRFAQGVQHEPQESPALDQIDPSVATDGTPAPDPKKRQAFRAATTASASASTSAQQSVTVQRIFAKLFAGTTGEIQDDTQLATHPTVDASNDEKRSDQAPFRILFGPDARSLFLSSRSTIFHIQLQNLELESGVESAPEVRTIFQSSFCLSSFKRARLFSISMAGAASDCQLLAVCSSDSIIWFDLDRHDQPLFSTEHHRGDDPTLSLTYLSRHTDAATSSAETDHNVTMWILTSRRNDLKSCYAVRAQRSAGPDYDLLRTNPATEDLSSRWKFTLDSAPVLLPTVAPSASGHDEPATLPFLVNAAEILQQDDAAQSWIAFQLDQRGALLAQLLRARSPSQHAEGSAQSHGGVIIDIKQPALDSYLYIDDAGSCHPKQGNIDSLSYVKTKILDYRKLHRALFAPQDDNPATSRRTDAFREAGHDASRLVGLWSTSFRRHAAIQAATFSLKEFFFLVNEDTGVGEQITAEAKKASRSPWSSAPQLEGDKPARQARAKAILDLRGDLRRALSSLGPSTAQGRWSRTAAVVYGHHTQHASLQNTTRSSLHQDDVLERTLTFSFDQVYDAIASYLPTEEAAKSWSARSRRNLQDSMKTASREMMLDLALDAEVFVRPKARILDEGAHTQRPQQRQGTNWTALEHRDIYRFVEEQGDTIPPPLIGSVGLSFFAPLRGGDIETATAGPSHEQNGVKKILDQGELEALLPSTSSTARLLLAEWQLGEDPSEYSYMDPFQGLHRLPRASRMRGPTARARSRSFSRASSASTEDRSRSRSRSRKQSAVPSLSQSSMFDSQGPPSSYPPSLLGHSQAASAASPAPPTLVSRRKRPREDVISRSQPIRLPMQTYDPFQATESRSSHRAQEAFSSAQSQPPRFGFAGSFGDLTPAVSPASSQVGTLTQSHFGAGAAATQIEAGRFGARPVKADRPPKKKKRASGF